MCCVCVFPSLDCIVEKKVASQRPIVPSSSALPDRYRSEWAAPDGSGGTRSTFFNGVRSSGLSAASVGGQTRHPPGRANQPNTRPNAKYNYKTGL